MNDESVGQGLGSYECQADEGDEPGGEEIRVSDGRTKRVRMVILQMVIGDSGITRKIGWTWQQTVLVFFPRIG